VKLRIVAVGHRMPPWINAGFDDYARRMPREMPLTITEIKPEPRNDKPSAGDIARLVEQEAQRIDAALTKGSQTVVLDETGKTVTTRQLADKITLWRDDGRDVSFVIGGADGTAARMKKNADWLWSLSPLTLPHGLVRVVLAEQLYRAVSILGNHPYHRD
jgi:23S rRNA (pseudouridine1915-N3)-methyltransferase